VAFEAPPFRIAAGRPASSGSEGRQGGGERERVRERERETLLM
jgi:hypothetical protein